jgi:hypothetical protein
VKQIFLVLKQFFNVLLYYRQDGARQRQDLLNFPAAAVSAKAVVLADFARL